MVVIWAMFIYFVKTVKKILYNISFNKMLTKTIFKISNYKIIQFILLIFIMLGGGIFIGYGDIIQNYGSKYNPPNFILGLIIKLGGSLLFFFPTFKLFKDYKPIQFKSNK